jgi:hypothetical protein
MLNAEADANRIATVVESDRALSKPHALGTDTHVTQWYAM